MKRSRDSLNVSRLVRDEREASTEISTRRNGDPIRKDNRSPRPRNATELLILTYDVHFAHRSINFLIDVKRNVVLP